jgi:hypothetical protein
VPWNRNDFHCDTVISGAQGPKGPRAQVKIGSMTCCLALSQLSPAHGFPFTKIRFMGLPKNGGWVNIRHFWIILLKEMTMYLHQQNVGYVAGLYMFIFGWQGIYFPDVSCRLSLDPAMMWLQPLFTTEVAKLGLSRKAGALGSRPTVIFRIHSREFIVLYIFIHRSQLYWLWMLFLIVSVSSCRLTLKTTW